MKLKILALLLIALLVLSACTPTNPETPGTNPGGEGGSSDGGSGTVVGTDIGRDDVSYGESIRDLGAYDGLFDGTAHNVKINCVSGTPGCYKVEGNTIVFTPVSAESVYSISGELSGNIVINTGDLYKFELELSGLSLVSDSTNPISVFSGDEVSIQAKKGTKNYIYDLRETIPETDTLSVSDAIYSEVDLEISGKGKLFVVSNNNGIHSKKDLQVKNLDLLVSCRDNALKGNDSVELENSTATLIASAGDAVKTSNSDISNKGNQRGTVSVISGSYDLYSACDGIDAAYDVTVSGGSIGIFTDGFSAYTENNGGALSSKGIKASNKITVNGGNIQIRSTDNAIHASNTSPLENGVNPVGSISISDGDISVYTRAEAIHSDGILYLKGGRMLLLSTSDGHSAINAGKGYTYSAGEVVAIMSDGEAASGATNCVGFNNIGKQVSLSLSMGEYLTCTVGSAKLILRTPLSLNSSVVMLGASNAAAEVSSTGLSGLPVGSFIWE